MAIITLTSDWGLSDHYVSAVKGAIISRMPDATIIDITHSISKFSLGETAFIVKNAYTNFPKGSIHIIGVNSESSIEMPHVVMLYDGHYFIGSDNGLLALLCDKAPEQIIEITVMQDSDYFTFPSRDIFAKVACMIAEELLFAGFGQKLHQGYHSVFRFVRQCFYQYHRIAVPRSGQGTQVLGLFQE